MQCVVKTKPQVGHLELTTRPITPCGPFDVLVKVKAAAVCGTDVHIQQWHPWAATRVTPPMIIGHEFAGEVVEVGSEVTHLKTGQIVSAETHIVCNRCQLCRQGALNVCYNTKP
ncbi:MAG: alcohol dehydrogenase catalytic domain-containing protein [Candidatus Adiutrix sp.]